MTGTVPSWLRRLPLSALNLMVTSACVPNDTQFQEWLATIEFLPSGCGRPAAEISEIDIAVFYTPAARSQFGGSEEIEAAIGLWIAEANQAYVDGGVNQQLVLAALQEVQYTEAGRSRHESLTHLSGTSDGHMDEVHAVRNQVGADLVHLVAVKTDGCGIAERPGVFGITCDDALTFSHEVGHNMGLSHDRYVTNGGQLPYSYGYVN